MCDKNHVVGIDGAERRQTVSNDGEQSDKGVVDDIDDIQLLLADFNPSDEKQYPRESEEGDEGAVKSDEKTKRPTDVTAESLQAAFELGTT